MQDTNLKNTKPDIKTQNDMSGVDLNSANKSLLAITWPIFIDVTLHFATLIINMAMVGAVSVQAVAELTVGNQVFDLCLIIFNFINIGVSVVSAQALGAGNKKLLRRLVHTGIGFNIISGTCVSLLVYFGAPLIVKVMNVPAEILDKSQSYLQILAFCFLFQALCLVSAAILRAYECTRDAMYVSIIINLCTIFGNSMFLFGFLGMPILGVEGVAISTVAGRIIGVLIFIPLILRRTRVRIIPRFLFCFKKKIFAAILNVGLPGAGENLSWHSQYMFMMAIIATMGSTALATTGIYFQMITIFMLFAISIAMGTEILIAHYAGALKLDLAYRQLLKSVRIGIICTIIITCTLPFGLGEFIITRFTSSDEVLALATPMFVLTVFMEPGRILNIIIINSLRATGDTKFPLMMAVISMWGVSVPVGCFLGLYMEMGLLGVWIGFCCDEWIRGICMFLRWRSRAWEKAARRNYQKHLQMAG